ncbi:MAG: hypothetical protein KJ578_03200 [Bacteroidetes bacterium]|nr:hypothetical protein [Bacteroidota bacterium]MBU1579770.1 hypothetical protein [Bacteroidota bacterium]MBU2465851.1 hypothetical protein [Bacteroidota bacterium]MBU2556770.1 hypothetical protein [Bacteroidota bacterium]
MMIKQLLFICFLIQFSVASAQILPPQHLFRHGLEGKVKSISEIVSANDSSSAEFSLITATFNEAGYIQTVQQFKNEALFSVLKYYYQQDSVADYAVEYNPNGSVYIRIRFETDENGFVERAFYDRSEQKKVDANRQPIELEYYQFYQAQYHQIRIKHDFTGRMLSQKYYSLEDDLLYAHEYEYDFRSNLTGMKYKNAKNHLIHWSKFLYNDKMLVKQQKVFRDNTLIEKINTSYELDEQKNWVKKVATHIYPKNIYNQNKQDKTEIRTRSITYYEE